MNSEIYKQIRYLNKLNEEELKKYKKNNSSYMYMLGLTMYGDKEGDIYSYIYHEKNKSIANDSFSLHPDQVEVLKLLRNENVFLSAPTSFGKSYVFFEYIIRFKPKKIVLIAPTLALLYEYKKKLKKILDNNKLEHTIYSNIDFSDDEVIDEWSIFLLTHERASNYKNWFKFTSQVEIDFAVIDEIHKLHMDNFRYSKTNKKSNQKTEKTIDGRLKELTFSKSLWGVIESSKRFLLIGPNIKDVNIKDNINFFKSDFKPVINDYFPKLFDGTIQDKWEKTIELMEKLKDKKIVYFSGPKPMFEFINYLSETRNIVQTRVVLDQDLNKVIEWINKNVHEEWYVAPLLKSGILVHNGAIPKVLRNKIIEIYEKENSAINDILVTSTLIDGVNTSAKSLIVTSARIKGTNLSSFDMGNLIGRTGRTGKHFVGETYHLVKSEKEAFDTSESNLEMSLKISIFENELDEDLLPAKNILTTEQLEFIKKFPGEITEEVYKEFFMLFKVSDLKYAINCIKNYLSEIEKFDTMRTYDKLKLMTDILRIGNQSISIYYASYMYNRNSLKDNIQSYFISKKDSLSFVDKSIAIDEMIKLYSGGIENTFHISIKAIYKLMLLIEGVGEKYANIIYSHLINPIDIKFFLDEDPIIRTMYSMGADRTLIREFKKTETFKSNRKMRNERKIIDLLKMEKFDTDDLM